MQKQHLLHLMICHCEYPNIFYHACCASNLIPIPLIKTMIIFSLLCYNSSTEIKITTDKIQNNSHLSNIINKIYSNISYDTANGTAGVPSLTISFFFVFTMEHQNNKQIIFLFHQIQVLYRMTLQHSK